MHFLRRSQQVQQNRFLCHLEEVNINVVPLNYVYSHSAGLGPVGPIRQAIAELEEQWFQLGQGKVLLPYSSHREHPELDHCAVVETVLEFEVEQVDAHFEDHGAVFTLAEKIFEHVNDGLVNI